MKPARVPDSALSLLTRPAKLCLIAAFVMVSLAPTPARSQVQSAGNVLLEPNEQLFCILAAVNAAGYDAGIGSSVPGTRGKLCGNTLRRRMLPSCRNSKSFTPTIG